MLEYLFRAIDEPGAYRLPFFNFKQQRQSGKYGFLKK